MREDMFKVIVERPRRGRGRATKSKLRYEKSGESGRMSGKRIVTYHNGDTKRLNENLAPLKRYLHKQTGRKWDAVFSEICQHLDTGSTVKMHVREHIDDFIIRCVRIDNEGQYWATGNWGAPVSPREWPELYVDPQTGLIQETAKLCRKLNVPTRREYWKQRRFLYSHDRPEYPVSHLSGNSYAVQRHGIWYAVEISGNFASLKEGNVSNRVWKMVTEIDVSEERNIYVISKQQMPKKQLRKLGLKNTYGGHYE